MEPMTPAESWLFILVVGALMTAAFLVAGRVLDAIIRWAKGHDGLEGVRRREKALDRMRTWTKDEL